MNSSLRLIIQKNTANIAFMEQEKPEYHFPVNSSGSA